MHRLFAAIRPPRAIRAQLLGLMEGVRAARWQSDAQLHITLRFIGEVETPLAEDIAIALGGVRGAAFGVALDGIGSFESGGRRGSLWAGVRPHDSLKALHRKIDSALRRCGVPPEHRAYLPHITLARLNRSSGPIDDFARVHAALTSAPFAVAEFCLYESFLAGEGACYEIVERYSLR